METPDFDLPPEPSPLDSEWNAPSSASGPSTSSDWGQPQTREESVQGLFGVRDATGYDGEEALLALANAPPTEIPTWSKLWNHAMGGGIPDGCFACIGATTGGGKTKMAARIVDGWLKAGAETSFFTMEPTFATVTKEIYACNQRYVRRGSQVDLALLRQWRDAFGWQAPLHVNSRLTITESGLILQLLREQATKGVSRFVLDFVQMVGSEAATTSDKAGQVRRTINRLYDLTRDYGVTVLVLSQLGSDAMALQRRPTMADLEWSRNIAQRADQVLLYDPTRQEDDPLTGETKGWLLHAKSRGCIRISDGIPFAVRWKDARFRDAEPDEVDSWPDGKKD